MVVGVGGAMLLFFLNMFVEALPIRLSQGVIPYAFLLPGLALVGLMLIYPTFQTINYSFANENSTEYVGFRTTAPSSATRSSGSRSSTTFCG